MLRVCDVRSRGRGFTLFKAADELKVSKEVMDYLLEVIYLKVGLIDKETGSYLWDFVTEDRRCQAMPMNFSKDEINPESEKLVKEAIDSELLVEVSEGFSLTEKSIKVLERAAQIQKERDSSTSSTQFYCPFYS